MVTVVNFKPQTTAKTLQEPDRICAAKRRVLAAAGAILFSMSSVPAAAQGVAATISGTVTDAKGAVIPGASVVAAEVDTGISHATVTNRDGAYTLPDLSVGSYTVKVTQEGFKTFSQRNIVLAIDQTLVLNIELQVGDINQSITVTGAPPLVNISSVEIGRTVEPQEITELPLVNRDAYSELSLTPGVQSNSGSDLNSGTPDLVQSLPVEDVVVNGGIDAGTAMVSFYLDGSQNMTSQRNYGNQLPDPDAIQEFRVETSNFSPEYGRFSGAVVTAVTHSGTDQFHGSLFEFNRNTDFNATPWDVASKQPYHRNNFGGTVGGPVAKNKAFFFFSYGGLQQATGQVLSGGYVPTVYEREGDFTRDSFKVYMPGTKTQVDGANSSPDCQTATLNCIPEALLDQTAANILAKYVPTTANAADNTWSGYFVSPVTDNEYLAKFNQILSAKDSIFAEYFTIRDAAAAFGGGDFLYSTLNETTVQQNAIISETHILNPTTVNQAWVGFTQAMADRVNSPAISLHNLGSTFTPQGAPALPQINVTGYFSMTSTTAGSPLGDDFYSVRDVINMTRGKHTLNLGGEIFLDHILTVGLASNYGAFTFATSAPETTGNALSDFVTGTVASMTQGSGFTSLLSTFHYGAFAADDYRIGPRLTVNLGLRYEIDTPPVQSENFTQTFVPNVQSTVSPTALEGLLYPGDRGVGRGPITTRFHHVSPRAGVIWDPTGDGKTALRAGFGVFYGAVSGNSWDDPADGLPFALTQGFNDITSFSNVYANPISFPNGDPFPYYYNPKNPAFLPGSSVLAVGLGFQVPYTYQINAALERQILGDTHFTIAYVGSMSHDLPFTPDVNYPQYAPGATTSTTSIESRRPYQDNGLLGQTALLVSNQTASYHSLQISAEKRMSRNFMLNGFYVWSHSFESANVADTSFSAQVQDYDAVWEERGPSIYDQRQQAALSGIWNLNYYSRANRAMKQLLDGWELSSIVTLDSGEPFSVLTGTDNNENGLSGTNRPNLVPGVSAFLSPHRSRTVAAAEWFNPAAFTPNEPGTGIGLYGADGNTPRDYLRAPGFRNIDLGAFRTFSCGEGIKMQLRAEATNAFNLVNLGVPNATLSSTLHGVITSSLANSNRQIQLGARLTF